MKIPVNLKKLDIDVDQHIKDSLKKNGFPPCLGCMYPPLVEYEPNIEIHDLFVAPESVDSINIMKINTSLLVPAQHTDKVRNTVISKNSFSKVNSQIIDTAEHYADSIIKCVKCSHIEVCDKLTKNYLKLVEISLKN